MCMSLCGHCIFILVHDLHFDLLYFYSEFTLLLLHCIAADASFVPGPEYSCQNYSEVPLKRIMMEKRKK